MPSWSGLLPRRVFKARRRYWTAQAKAEVVGQLVRQLVYTMFIGNNRTSFHLWRKENVVKHRKVSKYYETDCRFLCPGLLDFLRNLFLKRNDLKYGRSVGSDAIALNFSKELDSTDCSMRVLERSDF